MPDIFLCHSDADRNDAEELVSRLRAEGYSTWYAPNDILVGQSLVDAVFDGIRNSHLFLVLWTRNSSKSRWVERELNAAYVDDLHSLNTTILVLCTDDARLTPIVKALDRIDCREGVGLALQSIADKFESLGLKRSNHGSQTETEDLVERQEAEIWQRINRVIAPERAEDGHLRHGVEHTAQNIEEIRSKIDRCLNLIDHLCSVQDKDHYALICKYCHLGNNLAIANRDYSRQAQYMEMLYERTPPCVDNLILQGIGNACAGFRQRAELSLREAISLYAQLAESFGSMDIMRFVFRVTRHVRMAYTGSYLLVSSFVLADKQGRMDRLNSTLESLDAAMSAVLDFSMGSHNLLYGSILWSVGLTSHASRFLEKARELGEPIDQVYPEAMRELRTQLQETETLEVLDLGDLFREGPDGSLEYVFPVTTLQVSNFAFQCGNFVDTALDDFLEHKNPETHNQIHRDDELFGQGVEDVHQDSGSNMPESTD